MAHRIARRGTGFSVFAGSTEYQCEFVIFAAPTFLAPYLVEGFGPLHDFEYSPWLTANLTLERPPASYGAELYLGQRRDGFPDAGICGRDASVCAHAPGPHGLDVLLGAGRRIRGSEQTICS